MRRYVILSAMLTFSGCGYEDSRMAHQAQINLAGLSSADLQACAGVPDKAKKIDDRTEILTYNLKNDASGGVEITLPVIGGGYTIGGSGSSCNANIRLVDNRVQSIFYSGNNDRPIGTDGVCAPIVRGCMRRPQAGMLPPEQTRPLSSAFSQPAAPIPPPVPAPAPAPAAPEVVRMPTVGR